MALQPVQGGLVEVQAGTGETVPSAGWVTVFKLKDFDVSRGVEGEDEEFYIGETDPEITGGDLSADYTFNGDHDPGDAGQNAIRAAYASRDLLWCRVQSDSVTGIGEAQKIRVQGYSWGNDRNGRRFHGSGFTARGVGPIFQVAP